MNDHVPDGVPARRQRRRPWRLLNSTRSRVLLGIVTAAVAVLYSLVPASASTPYAGYNIYVHGFGSDGVYGYHASDSTAPTPIQAAPWPSGTAGWPVVQSPDHRFLYVGRGASPTPAMYVYAIGSDGRLSAVTPNPIPLPDIPVDLAFAPDGKHAYLTMGVLNETVQPLVFDNFGLPVDNGPAVPLGSATDALSSAVVSPDGTNLYVASYAQNQLVRFGIQADGTLTQALQRIGTDAGPIYPTITPDGHHLYVSDERGFDVSGYTIDASGALLEVPGSPFPSGQFPHVSSISPDSKSIYVPGWNGVNAYRVQDNGALTPLAGSPYPTTGGSGGAELCALSPTGDVLWVYGPTNSASHVLLLKYVRHADGTLTQDTSVIVDTGTQGADGRGVAVVPPPATH